eukprot:CAMPEP_0176061074 /NCGR_PEP_ID=MMETSP0120_2-20121206/30446_1 /TAXON_ID=160619 /ORGANISM="Kryptoperidinium foliaceum, Strain CCMP 1326" /LENGTH=698 /DNA_ID=CAMNT_0017394625 /DNA_START=82 /DNA_END=2178 /DNA_ORIENTATION=+
MHKKGELKMGKLVKLVGLAMDKFNDIEGTLEIQEGAMWQVRLQHDLAVVVSEQNLEPCADSRVIPGSPWSRRHRQALQIKLPWGETVTTEGVHDLHSIKVSLLKDHKLQVHQILARDGEDESALPPDKPLPRNIKQASLSASLNRVPEERVGCCVEWYSELCRSVELPDEFRQLGVRVGMPENRAISLKQLAQLEAFCKQLLDCVELESKYGEPDGPRVVFEQIGAGKQALNMYTLVDHIVKPLTKAFRCSFMELISDRAQRPQLFVSHAWSTAFYQTCRLLRFHLEERMAQMKKSADELGSVTLWICTFANNQHDLNSLKAHLMDTPFVRAIRQSTCEYAVVVLDEEATPFKRIWCVLEAHVCHHQRHQRDFRYDIAAWVQEGAWTAGPDRHVEAQASLLLDDGPGEVRDVAENPEGGGRFPEQIARVAVNMDIEHAKAARPEDQENILEFVRRQPGGFHDFNVNVRSFFAGTAVRALAREGEHSELKRLLDAYPEAAGAKSAKGATALFVAAYEGQEECIGALLGARARLDETLEDGKTPLFLAAQSGKERCLEALLQAGANVNVAATNGATPLLIAAMVGQEACLRALLRARANVHAARKTDGATALHIAARDQEACLRALLEARADANEKMEHGVTPLHIAVRKGQEACLRALLEARADMNKADETGETPLLMAEQEGKEACRRALLDARSQVD